MVPTSMPQNPLATLSVVDPLLTSNSAFFDNITYVKPKVPTLYTVLGAGPLATNPSVYGDYTHPLVLEKDQVVQVVVNNLDKGTSPLPPT